MPPRLKSLPPKFNLYPRPTTEDPSDALTVGNLRVGPNGVEFIGEADLHVPRPDLNIDRMRRIRRLGQGTQGNVFMYMAPDDAVFAVKRILISPTARAQNHQIVAAELRNIFSNVSNPYMVERYNAFYRNATLLLVMEYMDWGSLLEVLGRAERLPETIAAYVIAQVLRALEMLHKKSPIVTETKAEKGRYQIHRDIKPANVLLSFNGDVKLADFGIATSAETFGADSFVGTATYMSPERIQGQRYGTSSDIWSVGVVTGQVLLGVYPFASSNLSFMALLRRITTIESIDVVGGAGCSQEAQDFVNSCTRHLPGERGTAVELLRMPWITKNETKGKDELISLLKQLGSENSKNTSFHKQDRVI
ncbi:unnamed protein product [Phytomonas sp. Hart1]|nr:unnamed protein product [Phytomonas sp. Hart1]|eukprot:CCW66576.1 unnamed protein product [Phytomonas sp. isolate Hart1]